MMDGAKLSNEWHEQVSFSDLYFQITSTCRSHQYKWEVDKWKGCVLSKVSLISGLFKTEELEELDEELEKVDCVDIENDGELYNALFKFERYIDSMMNKKMPFLNIKKQDDIRGL